MSTFDSSIPAANHTLSSDQVLMLGNNQYLQTSVGTDHNFTNNTATSQDGHHTTIHFVKRTLPPDPAPIVNVGQLYTKTVGSDVQLFWLSGTGTPEQLSASSGGAPSGNGFVFLPGGIIMQWGAKNSPGGSGSVTFPLPGGFPTNVFSITTGINRPATSNAQQFYITSFNTNGYTYSSTSTGSTNLFWIAIGN